VVDTAQEVCGDNVKMYGLFLSTLCSISKFGNLTRELSAFTNVNCHMMLIFDFVDNDYVGYYIHDHVETHSGRRLGVYCKFQLNDVCAPSGLNIPRNAGITM